jgi:hypothetical protein
MAAAFVPPVPVIGPVIAWRPEPPKRSPPIKKRKRQDPLPDDTKPEGLAILTAFSPTRKTTTLFDDIGKGKGKLFVLSDGNEQTHCLQKDKQLYSAMKKIRKKFGKPLEIESGYRSKAYNAALRKRSKNVAKNSYHVKCRAIDFRVPGVSMKKLARYAATLPEVGGIGTYRTWVHIDSGRRRYW